MRCFVEFDVYAVIIEIPEPVGLKIKKYRNRFLDWIYDKNAKHSYLKRYTDSRGKPYYGANYDENAFVYWLNECVIKDKFEPAVIVERNLDPNMCPEGMVKIFF